VFDYRFNPTNKLPLKTNDPIYMIIDNITIKTPETDRRALIGVYSDLTILVASLPNGDHKTLLNRILGRLEAIVAGGSESNVQ